MIWENWWECFEKVLPLICFGGPRNQRVMFSGPGGMTILLGGWAQCLGWGSETKRLQVSVVGSRRYETPGLSIMRSRLRSTGWSVGQTWRYDILVTLGTDLKVLAGLGGKRLWLLWTLILGRREGGLCVVSASTGSCTCSVSGDVLREDSFPEEG